MLRSLLFVVMLLAGCSQKTEVHGYIPPRSDLEQLSIGTSTKAEVLQRIGAPIFSNQFDESLWYYVFFRTGQVGYGSKEIVEHKILQLVFNDEETLLHIRTLDKDDLVDLTLDSGQTPSTGRTMTVGEQIIGNIGRFNK